MPLSPTCIARYRADAGLFSDAGVTPAVVGDGIYQWNDLTGNGHHLTQATAANRPIYSGTSAAFNGSATFLNLSSTLNLPGTGCAVLICSRGTGPSIFTIGTTAPIHYGLIAGSPDAMALADSSAHLFPQQTYLPTLTPIAHGFRCTPAITRLFVGTNQTSDLAYDTSTFNSSGGMLGQLFAGDIFELAIYSPAPNDSSLQQLLTNLQDYNGISDVANTNQIIFIGDSNITTCPAAVCNLNGDLFKPLVLAQTGHTISQQQGVVSTQLSNLDLAPFSQTLAIVCAGTNDATAGRSTTQIVTDLKTLCGTLNALQMKVVLATIPDPALSAVNVILQNTYTSFADALVNWAWDVRLADPTNTTAAKDGVKAAILQPVLELFLNPPQPLAALTYASFYTGGRTLSGSFGHFVQS